jgi:hypothetical protein
MARFPAVQKAMANLRKWARRDDWAAQYDELFDLHFGVACEALGVGVETLVDALDDHSLAMLEGGVLEDFVTCELDDGRNLIEAYLARRGWNEPVAVRRWLQALRASRVSLWEVVALDPGRTLTLKDLLAGGAPVVVDERVGSESAVLWDRLMARVVAVGGTNHLTGALLLFGHEAADAAVERFERAFSDLRREIRKAARAVGEAAPDDAALRDYLLDEAAPILTQEWLIDAFGAATEPLPELVNTDGEALVFAELRLPLAGEASQAAQRLDQLATLDREPEEDGAAWNWLDPDEDVAAGAPAAPDGADRATITTRDAKGRNVLGSVRIRDAAVVLDTNSRERAERGCALLAQALDGLVGAPATKLRTLEEIREEGGGGTALPETDLTPEEQAAFLAEYLDEHYRSTLDQAVPMLDDKTPRQAARTKKGREAVVGWLKYLENNERRRAARSGEPTYDFLWMWVELGVIELRQ